MIYSYYFDPSDTIKSSVLAKGWPLQNARIKSSLNWSKELSSKTSSIVRVVLKAVMVKIHNHLDVTNGWHAKHDSYWSRWKNTSESFLGSTYCSTTVVTDSSYIANSLERVDRMQKFYSCFMTLYNRTEHRRNAVKSPEILKDPTKSFLLVLFNILLECNI